MMVHKVIYDFLLKAKNIHYRQSQEVAPNLMGLKLVKLYSASYTPVLILWGPANSRCMLDDHWWLTTKEHTHLCESC